MRRYKDDSDEHGILKDGHRFRVPVKLADSAAFPRPQRRTFVTAADGGTMNLHKPGYRIAVGGHAGDQALRDSVAEESERARDRYIHDITNAWKRRDEWPEQADDDDAETEARSGAARNALLSRGHDPDDIDAWLDDLDDDASLDDDIGQHVAAFEQSLNGRDASTLAQARRRKLDALYPQRDYELANAWRKGK
jgi:hypothetical protein